MNRSRWKVPLLCPTCFATGEAILSHSHDGPMDIGVEFLAPGFKVIDSNRTPDHVDIICGSCNVSARRDIRVRRRLPEMLMTELRKWVPKLPRMRRSRTRHREITAP